MNLLITFIILNIINVILQTAKSIATVRCGKTIAALANAAAYGLYTIVIIYTVCDLPLWQKVAIVAGANFVGVFIVKWIEQKLEKEKLWKVEIAIPVKYSYDIYNIHKLFEYDGIPNNYNLIGNYYIFNCYCMTKAQTKECINQAKELNGKFSAYESKS